MKLRQLIAAFAIALCAFSANAEEFNFSYTFGSGDVVSGSLSGTQNGNFVESVSNVSVFFNGNAMAGNPSMYQPYLFATGCCWVAGTPVISFDGALNNFIFSDAPPYSPLQTNYFTFAAVDGPWDIVAVSVPPVYVTDVSYNGSAYAGNDAFDSRRWVLTPVPEPEIYAMMGLGLGLIGWVGRRRGRQAVV